MLDTYWSIYRHWFTLKEYSFKKDLMKQEWQDVDKVDELYYALGFCVCLHISIIKKFKIKSMWENFGKKHSSPSYVGFPGKLALRGRFAYSALEIKPCGRFQEVELSPRWYQTAN